MEGLAGVGACLFLCVSWRGTSCRCFVCVCVLFFFNYFAPAILESYDRDVAHVARRLTLLVLSEGEGKKDGGVKCEVLHVNKGGGGGVIRQLGAVSDGVNSLGSMPPRPPATRRRASFPSGPRESPQECNAAD